MRKLVLPLILGLTLTLTLGALAAQNAPTTVPQSVNTGQHFLPPFGEARDRFGFDSNALSGYDVAQLHAGWYSNWSTSVNPAHPDQLVYVQLLRVRAGSDPHDPAQVTVKPSRSTIAQIAAAHPGSLWLVGNEPDSIYQGEPIRPEVYAVVYHDVYAYLKEVDPTALVANGGIVQPTPCRLEYLDIVLDTYLDAFGEPMPVDVWNIHAFVLREVYGSWGASTPPGVDPSCGMDYAMDDGDNIDIFWGNIQNMRAWMKERGYQDRPLVISEYGILWPADYGYPPLRVSHFMTQTFDLFLYETDPDIGYPADDDRLVQTWAWYSLSDDRQYNGYLFYSGSKAISPMGQAYAAYTAALDEAPYVDLSARLVAAQPDFTSSGTAEGTAGTLTFTVALAGHVGNLGKQPATDVLARIEILSHQDGTAIFGRDAFYDVPARFDGVVVLPPLTATLSAPGRHDLRLTLDPEGQVAEPRKWNNVATTTLDLRPDLAPLDLKYVLVSPGQPDTSLTLTVTAHNRGDWPSSAVSATLWLETWPEGALVQTATLAVPSLGVSERVSLTHRFTWSLPEQEIYHLRIALDEPARLSEQDEENNVLERIVPVTIRATLTPSASTVLTAAGGDLRLHFPAGLVTTPTQLIYTPLWPGEWPDLSIAKSSLAFSLTLLRGGQVVPLTFAAPFSATWDYGADQTVRLKQEGLRLFRRVGEGEWQDAACRPYQRDLVAEQVTALVCRGGQFLFGSRYDVHMPLILHQDQEHLAARQEVYQEQAPAWGGPGSPLRLP